MLLDQFANFTAKAKSLATAETYGRAATLFLEYLSSRRLDPSTLHKTALQDFVSDLESKHLRPKTIATYIFGVKFYLTFLEEYGGVEIPKLSRAYLPKIDPRPQVYLNKKELAFALDTVNLWPNPSKTAIIMLAGTGLRVTELCNVKRKDIEATDHGIMVKVVGKRNKYREVPVLDFAISHIKSYIKEFGIGLNDYLFGRTPTLPITRRAVDMWTLKLSKQINKSVHPHSFRHSYITMLHESGVDDITLSIIAGHSSINTTKIYTHPSRESIQSINKKVNKWLGHQEKD